MIWNPRLFPTGRRSTAVTSHVDLTPTIAALMGLPPAPSWQGRSVFAPDRPPRAYFYAANDLYLLGVRDGTWKYIYKAPRAREELYDLASDPDEQLSLAAANSGRCRVLRQRLAAWKAFAHTELARAQSQSPSGRSQ
jgi:arylsulfatase A-like enzyme